MRLLHKLAMAIVLISLLTMLFPISVAVADEIVTFPDPNLEAAIREAIGKPTGDIYQSDLMLLTELDASNRGIADLNGLQWCTSLNKLWLYLNQISDISPLSGLSSLTMLDLDQNYIGNISPLSALTSLTQLHLRSNAMSDISPLSGLSSLTMLGLDSNYISDISPLSGLTSLGQLYLDHNEISDISPLSGLTNLSYLILSSNQISDISPLSGLINLGQIILSANQISDLSPLSGLSSLSYIDVDFNQISDISPLSNLNNLNWLRLALNQISDISPLSGLTSLTHLFLDSNQIVDITPLLELTNLYLITLDYNQVSDIEPLVNNPGLSTGDFVYLEHNPLSPISMNTYIPQLQARGVTVLYTTPQPPNQPVNVLPSNGATGISLTPTLQSSAFSDPDVGDIHAASEWQIRTSSGSYSSPVYDSGTTATNLTSVTVPGGNLNYNTTYYWHVRHQDNHGAWSEYSNETSFTTTQEIVTFPDPNLEAAIREAIGKPSGDILQSDLVGLTMLDGNLRGIIDLTGIEHCTSLTGLYLGNNQISDISPLSGLTNLLGLYIGSNQISDISPLSGLPNLFELYICDNQISDISPLEGLTSLTSLYLRVNQISDISPLAGLTSFTDLYLGNNQISDISPLAGLTSLTYLDLQYNQISDISPLSGLTNLASLYISYNQISDISPLAGLTSFTDLYLGNNQISDLEPLVNNPGLSSGDTIDLNSNPLSTTSVYTYIPQLQARGVTVYYNASSNQAPNQPTNLSPSNGATGISLTPTLQSSTFSDPDPGDTHAASQWQVTITPGSYSSPVWDTGTDSLNLISFTIPAWLSYSTTYYWHVRHQDNHGSWSSWSTETSFTTRPLPIPPTVTTNNAGNVFSASAILRGNLDNLGTASSVDVSFQWTTDAHYGMHGDYDNETSPPWPMTSTGAFSYSLTGLSSDTTYHFRAIAVGDGTGYGNDMTFTTSSPGSDGDGVPASTEDAAPNGGDGNYDGIPDSQQSNVASLPNAANGDYATIESPSGTSLSSVAAVNVNSLPSQGKPNLVFPYGFFSFNITGIPAGSTVWLTLRFESSVPVGSQYWKFGPSPDNPTSHWYQIPIYSNDGDNLIQIPLIDGGLGDDDLTANGVIVDQGGPGNPPSPGGGGASGVPVFPSIYVGIGAALGAGLLAYFMRRKLVKQE